MNMTQVKEVVTTVLRERFAENGYSSADVHFKQDFDGEEVILVTLHLSKPVTNVDEIYDSVGAIRNRLQLEGDDRFVFIKQDFPSSTTPGAGAH
jgi:hypothetical protein